MDSSGRVIQINEILSYRVEQCDVRLHIIPEKAVKNVLDVLADGLRKLASIIDRDECIAEVSIRSWVVAEYPRVLERFGFQIDEKNSEELSSEKKLGGEREVWRAHISREQFLDMYLN